MSAADARAASRSRPSSARPPHHALRRGAPSRWQSCGGTASLLRLSPNGARSMNEITFEAALDGRVDQMLDACTRCGKCVEACPSVTPAGIAHADPEDIIGGILAIVRSGEGPQASRIWAQSCMLSGECIKACDEAVNPRFLLAMARVAMAKAEHQLPERRRQGVEKYRDLGRDVAVLSRL